MKKKENKIIIDNIHREKHIDLSELIVLSPEEQKEMVENVIDVMYEGQVEIPDGMINKCLKLSIAKHDDYMILHHHLIVEKFAGRLTFKFEEKENKIPLIILFFCGLLVALMSATYSGLVYLSHAHLNKDLDGDGVADINIDLDGDKVADVNIDLDGDDRPDLNIDYKGDRIPTFNLDTTGDGLPDFNLVNDATGDNIYTCKVNCDVNGDGWPNFNYDLDGDGVADLDIYSPEKEMVTEKIDINGDRVCDVMCDDDGDGVCDRNCTLYEDDILSSGPSTSTGNSNNNLESGSLMIEFSDNGEYNISGIMPDDKDYDENDYPSSTFKVTNKSNIKVSYKMTFLISENTYESDNFMYKIESNNGGFETDFTTAPWDDTLLSSYIVIGPGETQDYTITFKLHGTGEEQNYDQGKIFAGNIKVGD